MEIIKILFAKLEQKVLTQTPLAEMLGIIDMYSRVTMHVIALRVSLQYIQHCMDLQLAVDPYKRPVLFEQTD